MITRMVTVGQTYIRTNSISIYVHLYWRWLIKNMTNLRLVGLRGIILTYSSHWHKDGDPLRTNPPRVIYIGHRIAQNGQSGLILSRSGPLFRTVILE